jgi:hypothetical protein
MREVETLITKTRKWEDAQIKLQVTIFFFRAFVLSRFRDSFRVLRIIKLSHQKTV